MTGKWCCQWLSVRPWRPFCPMWRCDCSPTGLVWMSSVYPFLYWAMARNVWRYSEQINYNRRTVHYLPTFCTCTYVLYIRATNVILNYTCFEQSCNWGTCLHDVSIQRCLSTARESTEHRVNCHSVADDIELRVEMSCKYFRHSCTTAQNWTIIGHL